MNEFDWTVSEIWCGTDGQTDGLMGGQTDETDSNIHTWWPGPGVDNYRSYKYCSWYAEVLFIFYSVIGNTNGQAKIYDR